MTDTYGQKCFELSENVGPLGCLQRMSMALFQCLTPFSKIWKEKATPGKRILYRLALSVRPIKGNDCGLLPTPTTSNAIKNPKIRKPSPSDPNGRTISERLAFLATPTVSQCAKPIRIWNRKEYHGPAISEQLAKLDASLIGKRINPQFLEWMCGFPKDWTLLPETKPSETV